ncbi:MAG: ribosome small subunit-dependent GTPase A [Bacteroidia bacterium]|nr:ribosome small subunit-dependent GTPase A [Bacteroidia bacterium]
MQKGIVTKSTGSNYSVLLQSGITVNAKVKGKMRTLNIKSTNPVSVGDVVTINDDTAEYMISDFDKRRNYIVRKSVNLSKQTQVIAANIDQLLLINSLTNPKTQTGFIDRFLVTAEAQHIPTVIVFNKLDIGSDADLEEFAYYEEVYTQMGYTVIGMSVNNDDDVQRIKDITAGKTTLFSGNSGVGKSTLLNKLDSNITARVGEVSGHNAKGKHTTTFAELFITDYNARIIDTPGVKSFGIVDFERHEVAGYYADFRQFSRNCKFNNCTHINEPHCAVKQAVETGGVAEFRYNNYLNIYDSDEMEKEY